MLIGVFDSGKGGLTVLEEIKKLLPEEKYVYFGDSKNCPYGEKSLDELKEIVSGNAEYLLARGAKIIVVACNTATTQTIDFLRKKYPKTPFIGTEPAIKKACDESSESARIVLLATEGTAKAPRTRELVEKYKKPNQSLEILPCPGLAKAIEEENWTKTEQILSGLLRNPEISASSSSGKLRFPESELLEISEVSSALKTPEKQGSTSVETVILGCTHYPLIRDKIQEKFPDAKLIDGGEGVAREVKRIVEKFPRKENL